MGQIVGAFATSHTLGSPEAVEAQSERVFQGMKAIGAAVRAARPDVLLLITSDHLNNFSVAEPELFAVGVDAEMTPYGDMGLPQEPFPGAPAFAEALAVFAAKDGIDISRKQGVRPDHGVAIPIGIADPDHVIPTALLYLNTVFEPAPEPRQSWALGRMLARFIAQRPAQERVVLMAAGGLSHWVGKPEEGRVNADWDRAFLDRFNAGDGEGLADLTNAEILAAAGNGGLEVNAWIALAGAAPGAAGRTVYYEPIPAWATGMGGVALHLG
jgi:protocatechuate 4,5-dioxygenase beta chain/2'-aminobiphenyl-2,3-diol 1,2-dioxygenase large subunit